MKLLIATLFLTTSLVTTHAIADSSPAILGSIDTAHVQSLDNADEVRGELFGGSSYLLASILASSFCQNLSLPNRCIDKYTLKIREGESFRGIQVIYQNVITKKKTYKKY